MCWTTRSANASAPFIDAGHRFFGTISRGLAEIVEKAVSQWGLPNGYVLGQEAGGAWIAGLRYGEGVLYTKPYGLSDRTADAWERTPGQGRPSSLPHPSWCIFPPHALQSTRPGIGLIGPIGVMGGRGVPHPWFAGVFIMSRRVRTELLSKARGWGWGGGSTYPPMQG
jgi:hypothetical protein